MPTLREGVETYRPLVVQALPALEWAATTDPSGFCQLQQRNSTAEGILQGSFRLRFGHCVCCWLSIQPLEMSVNCRCSTRCMEDNSLMTDQETGDSALGVWACARPGKGMMQPQLLGLKNTDFTGWIPQRSPSLMGLWGLLSLQYWSEVHKNCNPECHPCTAEETKREKGKCYICGLASYR